MTGTERSPEPTPFADDFPDGIGRRGRALMVAGALIGTLMLATAGILVGGASSGKRLDAIDWHRTGPGSRDGSIPVAAESHARTAPTTLSSSARPAHTHPTQSFSAARRPTPKQAPSARPTSRATHSTRPTPAAPAGPAASRTPTPERVTITPSAQPARPSVTPPPTAVTTSGRTHTPPGHTRHPRHHKTP
ncbi:hypothetical protein ACIBQ1_03160 [Nonomuraea sp. NPDC050153]|uniref:hypothetical protein n=1 Tax=Nonomuraea sp. NPDC050153 TaxID=3364359 RepID=UPI0037900D09